MMAAGCAAVGANGSSPAMTAWDHRLEGMRLTDPGMRRSKSAPQLRCSLAVARAGAPPSLKSSRSVEMFPIGSIITNTIRSFLFESEEAGGEVGLVEPPEEHEEEVVAAETENSQEKRANWVSRILELRRRWRDRQQKEDDDDEEEEEEYQDGYCGVGYDDLEEDEKGADRRDWDRKSFEKLLGRVQWSDAELFSQLAYLCNKAYEIPDIKVSSSSSSPQSVSSPTAPVQYS